MKVEKYIPARHPKTARKIPETIHQTFSSVHLESKMHDAVQSWLNLNPSYEYRFHDDADQIEFLRNYFDKRVLEAYLKLKEGAFRADLWRYCILYEFGGVYVDVDAVCLAPLNDFINSEIEFTVPAEKGTGGPAHTVFNAFICSSARHPFLARTIEYVTELIHCSSRYDGFTMVGPGGLGATAGGR